MTDDEKSILFELRESARVNRNEKYRELARKAADELAHSINRFSSNCSRASLVEVNGLWALAERLLKNQPTDDAPGGGQVRVESTEKIRVAA